LRLVLASTVSVVVSVGVLALTVVVMGRRRAG
jgi:hypothetical protein